MAGVLRTNTCAAKAVAGDNQLLLVMGSLVLDDIAFLVVLLAGFYLWYWPRMRAWSKIFTLRRRHGRYRWHLDPHNAIGLVTLIRCS